MNPVEAYRHMKNRFDNGEIDEEYFSAIIEDFLIIGIYSEKLPDKNFKWHEYECVEMHQSHDSNEVRKVLYFDGKHYLVDFIEDNDEYKLRNICEVRKVSYYFNWVPVE